jgi:hypothetical protein
MTIGDIRLVRKTGRTRGPARPLGRARSDHEDGHRHCRSPAGRRLRLRRSRPPPCSQPAGALAVKPGGDRGQRTLSRPRGGDHAGRARPRATALAVGVPHRAVRGAGRGAAHRPPHRRIDLRGRAVVPGLTDATSRGRPGHRAGAAGPEVGRPASRSAGARRPRRRSGPPARVGARPWLGPERLARQALPHRRGPRPRCRWTPSSLLRVDGRPWASSEALVPRRISANAGSEGGRIFACRGQAAEVLSTTPWPWSRASRSRRAWCASGGGRGPQACARRTHRGATPASAQRDRPLQGSCWPKADAQIRAYVMWSGPTSSWTAGPSSRRR